MPDSVAREADWFQLPDHIVTFPCSVDYYN